MAHNTKETNIHDEMALTSSLYIYIYQKLNHPALRLISFGIGVPKGGMPLPNYTLSWTFQNTG